MREGTDTRILIEGNGQKLGISQQTRIAAIVIARNDLLRCSGCTIPLLVATIRARSHRTKGVPVSNGSLLRAPLSTVLLGDFPCELLKLATETPEPVLLLHESVARCNKSSEKSPNERISRFQRLAQRAPAFRRPLGPFPSELLKLATETQGSELRLHESVAHCNNSSEKSPNERKIPFPTARPHGLRFPLSAVGGDLEIWQTFRELL